MVLSGPKRRAVVQLFAYDEPRIIGPTMDAYAAAPVPDGWSVDYEAWVTPTPDKRTMRAAGAHDTFMAFHAPTGKLSTRNKAHDLAMRDEYDVIVTADADEPPADGSYLPNLLSPLEESGVVASTGFPEGEGVFGAVMNAVRRVDHLRQPIRGNTSAFETRAWATAGPFRVGAVPETSIRLVRAEEEFTFRRRLEGEGEVVDAWDANVRANDRRNVCSVQDALMPFGQSNAGYCGRRGVETFSPVDDGDEL